MVHHHRRGGRREARWSGCGNQSGDLLSLSADSAGSDEPGRGDHGAGDSSHGGDPAGITPAVRQEVRTLDPSQPVFDVRGMQDVLYGSVAQPRFRTFLIGMFAALALVLAALGLYGVVAYSVSQRTTELGIRVALGAQPGSIVKLVVLRAAGLAALGLGIGLAITLAGSRIIARFLFGVQPGRSCNPGNSQYCDSVGRFDGELGTRAPSGQGGSSHGFACRVSAAAGLQPFHLYKVPLKPCR